MIRSLHASHASLLISALLLAACGEEGAQSVDFSPLLTSLTQTAAIPQVTTFAKDAAALEQALGALETSATIENLASAQQAWRVARVSLRRLDALNFGPIADDALLERIDVRPADPAAIDTLLAGTAAIDVAAVGVLGGKSKGFLGLEYLLFDKKGPAAALVKLDGNEGARRRALSHAIAQEIDKTATSLAASWTMGEKPYANEIATAGAGSVRYPRQRGALDDYLGAVYFSLEWVVGIRLAEPLGRRTTGTPDASLDFTPHSDSAGADLRASLAGSRAVFDSGLGAQLQQTSLPVYERAVMEFDACKAKIEAIPQPFDTAITTNTAVVQAAFDACKALKASWNLEITSALGATTRPPSTDGD